MNSIVSYTPGEFINKFFFLYLVFHNIFILYCKEIFLSWQGSFSLQPHLTSRNTPGGSPELGLHSRIVFPKFFQTNMRSGENTLY
jgi:hypothetical protein